MKQSVINMLTNINTETTTAIETVFKRCFKFYKRRYTEPDLSEVFDLSVTNLHLGIVCHRLDPSLLSARDYDFIKSYGGFCSLDEWTVSAIEHRPGLYILSNMLSRQFQMRWLQNCLLRYSEPPNVTNLSTLGTYTADNVFRTCREKLRWVTMGNDYNWSRKEYDDRPRQALPEEIPRLAELVSHVLGLGETTADAAIINYYPEKATLSPHVDRSERDMSRPLISLSLGQSAIYLTGGDSLDDPVDALTLNSGDILVMHAAQRMVYHAIPRILKTTTFRASDHEEVAPDVVEFANRCRVNMTIRQVD